MKGFVFFNRISTQRDSVSSFSRSGLLAKSIPSLMYNPTPPPWPLFRSRLIKLYPRISKKTLWMSSLIEVSDKPNMSKLGRKLDWNRKYNLKSKSNRRQEQDENCVYLCLCLFLHDRGCRSVQHHRTSRVIIWYYLFFSTCASTSTCRTHFWICSKSCN